MKCIDYTAEGYWDGILNASFSKFFILKALTDGPAHGYEIIRRVEKLTEGLYTPTEGTIYPVMREFLDCACVSCSEEVVNGRTRKVYALTAKGHGAYRAGVDIWRRGIRCVEKVIASNF